MTDLSKKGIAGSIAGFDTINIDPSGTTEASVATNFSASEMMSILLSIRKQLPDPSVLAALATKINAHITNTANPHHDNASQMQIDVFGALYTYWVSLGNIGTEGDFAAILFSEDVIANLQDILDGTVDSLVDVSGVTGLIAYHNADPAAHPAMLAQYFPGTPPISDPSISIQALIGLPVSQMTTTRAQPLSYISANGTLQFSQTEQIPLDYLTGEPLFPLWGARTNLVTYSDPSVNPTVQLINTVSRVDPTTLAPDMSIGAYVVTDTTTASEHAVAFGISGVAGTEYTTSFFCAPKLSTGFIHVYYQDDPETGFWYNLTDGSFIESIPGTTISYAYQLSTGWIRFGIQRVAQTTGNDNLVVGYVPTSTSSSYLGTGVDLFALYGLMHATGPGVSPLIPTTGTSASVDDTQIIVIAPEVISPVIGMISIGYRQAASFETIKNSLVSTPDTGFGIILNSTTNLWSAPQPPIGGMTTNIDYVLATPTDVVYGQSTPLVVGVSYCAQEMAICVTGTTKKVDTSATFKPLQSSLTQFTFGPIDGYLEKFVVYPDSDVDQDLEFITAE